MTLINLFDAKFSYFKKNSTASCTVFQLHSVCLLSSLSFFFFSRKHELLKFIYESVVHFFSRSSIICCSDSRSLTPQVRAYSYPVTLSLMLHYPITGEEKASLSTDWRSEVHGDWIIQETIMQMIRKLKT